MNISLQSILKVIGYISLSNLISHYDGNIKAKRKIGHQLNKIKEINYQLSLKKLKPEIAAEKIFGHIKAMEILSHQIAEDEPIKQLLTVFSRKWKTENQICKSLTDGMHQFMSEVTSFFLRGYLPYSDARYALISLFRH